MNPAILIDAVVVVVYFGLVLGIGLWMSRGQRSVEGFALGNREIAWWAVMASILASEISAGTFFGTPGEGFHLRNYTYLQLIVGYLLARVIVSFVFIPAYYRHNVVSIYEFLGTRFGPRTRRIASAVFLVTRLLASGTRLWVPTVIFVMMWHLSFPEMKITPLNEFLLCGGALVIITLATSVYTTLGGIRAVIWTDVLQICVLFAALGFSLVYLISHVGGWAAAKPHLLDAELWDWGTKSSDSFWRNVKNVLEQEYTVWAAFIASTCVTLATHGTDQDMVQRMLTAKNKRQSAVATILSGLIDIPITLCVLGIGILLAVHYGAHPDPLLPTQANGNIAPNKVFPYFILTAMPSGLRGLVIAGVLATAMGSLSTAINSLATSYVRDFHFRWFGEPPDEAGKLRSFRFGTILFSVLFIAVGLGTAWVSAMNPQLRIVPIILGIFGYTYGSLLGVFLLGLFTRTRGSELGNALGMLIGFLVVVYLSGLDRDLAHLLGAAGFSWPAWTPPFVQRFFGPDGLPRPDGMPIIEFPWRVFFGTLTTFLIAVCFRTPSQRVISGAAPPAERLP